MYRLEVGDLAVVLTSLQTSVREAANHDRRNPGAEAPKGVAEAILLQVERLREFQENLQFDDALKVQLFSFHSSLKKGRADLRSNALKVQIEVIVFGLIQNLKSRLFLFVPADRARYYQNLSLFGDSAYIFSEAMKDMADAGTCYAADLSTACVFHLMRVSEHGLRAIAKKMRVSIRSHKGKCPIEYADWEKVITAIENKIVVARRKPIGLKRSAEIAFYSDVVSHCRYIRDIWRNEVSHTRTEYTLSDAYAAMMRVAELMKALAKGLYSEKELREIMLKFFGDFKPKSIVGESGEIAAADMEMPFLMKEGT